MNQIIQELLNLNVSGIVNAVVGAVCGSVVTFWYLNHFGNQYLSIGLFLFVAWGVTGIVGRLPETRRRYIDVLVGLICVWALILAAAMAYDNAQQAQHGEFSKDLWWIANCSGIGLVAGISFFCPAVPIVGIAKILVMTISTSNALSRGVSSMNRPLSVVPGTIVVTGVGFAGILCVGLVILLYRFYNRI